MSALCKTELSPTDRFADLGRDLFIALWPNAGTQVSAPIVAENVA